MRIWKTPASRLHSVPAGFPEIPERLEWAEAACRNGGFEVRAPSRISRPSTTPPIAAVHRDDRLARARAATPGARIDVGVRSAGDAQPPIVPDHRSLRAGWHHRRGGRRDRAASGSGRFATGGETSLAGPPADTAADPGRGFCFNNIAIAARERSAWDAASPSHSTSTMAAGLGHLLRGRRRLLLQSARGPRMRIRDGFG
jgi:acetoin utilization deacetylase AcuC-like enzyme